MNPTRELLALVPPRLRASAARLIAEVVAAETAEIRDELAGWVDLALAGEAARDALTLRAIVGGAFGYPP